MGLLVAALVVVEASLFGPWFRYECSKLGFRIPVASGWRVTEVPNGIVFAMQYQPHPYVRVAVGRVPLGNATLDSMADQDLRMAVDVRRTTLTIDGAEAIKLEGSDAAGPFMDLFVRKADFCYWIGFAADDKSLWPQYSKTFDIILDGFHFLESPGGSES